MCFYFTEKTYELFGLPSNFTRTAGTTDRNYPRKPGRMATLVITHKQHARRGQCRQSKHLDVCVLIKDFAALLVVRYWKQGLRILWQQADSSDQLSWRFESSCTPEIWVHPTSVHSGPCLQCPTSPVTQSPILLSLGFFLNLWVLFKSGFL